MPLKKTEAIVLKSQRQGETSKILTLYTIAFGKVKVIAKGARGVRSKFGGNLEPLNYVAIVFFEKESREIQILSQAEIIEPFAQIKAEVEKTAIALAVCELINRLEIGLQPNPGLFRLQLETLKAMNRTPQPLHVFRAFQTKLFEILGIRPNLTSCLKCNRQKNEASVFDIPHGGFLCEACNPGAASGMVLSSEALAALRSLQQNPITDVNGLVLSTFSQSQVDDLIAAYLKYHVAGMRELNSLRFLKKLKRT
ncbi:MAG: DNA repair protein RecO [bacterium]